MKLLISPKNEAEAQEAIAGGADIIDVKNPQEGALGANYPWVISAIKKLAPTRVEISCAIGDAPNMPGSFSLAALGAASLGVDYVKVGLFGVRTVDEAIFLLRQVIRAAKNCSPHVKVVAAGYADFEKIGTIDPVSIPEIASRAGADVVMLDTATKNGSTLFDYQSAKQLEDFVASAHNFGLAAALAGSLRRQDISMVYRLGTDIVGLRGAACTNNDRNGGIVTRELVTGLKEALRQIKRA